MHFRDQWHLSRLATGVQKAFGDKAGADAEHGGRDHRAEILDRYHDE
jgi:hypothetical protein